mgnify:CR=1 FL=1
MRRRWLAKASLSLERRRGRFRALALTLVLLCCACSEPCVEEVVEFREFVAGPGEPSAADSYERDGWDCRLLASVTDVIFGTGVRRDWRCTRCR